MSGLVTMLLYVGWFSLCVITVVFAIEELMYSYRQRQSPVLAVILFANALLVLNGLVDFMRANILN